MDEPVRLRPLDPEEARSIKAAAAEMGPEVAPGGSPDGESAAQGEGQIHEGRVELGIEAGGRLVGLVHTYIPPDRTLPFHTFEIGIILHVASARGRGTGTEALRLFIRRLQAEGGARRIHAVTALDNHAMRRSLSKLGFTPGEEILVSGIVETIFVLELS